MSQATSTSVVTDGALRSRLLTGAAGQVCALGLLGLWLHTGADRPRRRVPPWGR